MRRSLLMILGLFLAVSLLRAQAPATSLKLRAVLVDKELNQKPVPHLTLVLTPADPPGPPVTLKTDLQGAAQAQLPPGKYKLSTPARIEFEGQRYGWEMDLALTGPEFRLELSNDNAQATPVAPAAPAAGLSAQFHHLRNSVATVYSDFGSGTGFLVDPAGLLLTNEHVISKSDYLAVQFDEKRKVAATLLASDPLKDVAVLWVNLAAFPEAVVAPLVPNNSAKARAVEGERVFTIGSPLDQQKVLTTGVVSRVEDKAIISDININPGNSGGPLFNSAGMVIGVTTYSKQASRGPGLSGIVRIEEAMPLVAEARAKISGAAPPSAALLPVEPVQPFPLDALRALPVDEKVDLSAYAFAAGDFRVRLFTPAQEYRLYQLRKRALEKEREKRNRKRGDAPEADSGGPDVKEWQADEHKPTLTLTVMPQLKVKFWASMAAPGNEIKARFKTDFYRMRLLCGQHEIVPIRPGKIPVSGGQGGRTSIEDSTFIGLYEYPPDAVNPTCGQMTLEIYADKNTPPTVKQLATETIEAVWNDFEPYRKARSRAPAPAPSPRN